LERTLLPLAGLDPQNSHERIFVEAFKDFSVVARATQPSRLVDEGWNTSSSKILDNALIGYCQSELLASDETTNVDEERVAGEARVAEPDVRETTAPHPRTPARTKRRWFGLRRATPG